MLVDPVRVKETRGPEGDLVVAPTSSGVLNLVHRAGVEAALVAKYHKRQASI